MNQTRIPRKLKKALKSQWLKHREMWKSHEIVIDSIQRHYKHWRKVEHVGSVSLTAMHTV